MGRGETNTKKRKRRSEVNAVPNGTHRPPPSNITTDVDTSKPTAVFQPTKGREWTVSVALPGSIIANAQARKLRMSMAGHIARALSVFCVDEVIVFSDGHIHPPSTFSRNRDHTSGHAPAVAKDKYTAASDPDHFLIQLLSYLETPPHLRIPLFPMHPNLENAGTLPSLDLPHHLRPDEWCPYREGVSLAGTGKDRQGTKVEAGLRIPITVDDEIPANTRVTLKFDQKAKDAILNPKEKIIHGEAVSPDEPREEGYYWGFNVRKAGSLSDVFTECAFDGGYDMAIGTSERGEDLEVIYSGDQEQKVDGFKHLLVVFGGVAGLEVAVKNDAELQKLGVVEAKDVFDRWINLCPGQGSRTIRTEEAIWIGLMGLRRLVVNNK